MVAKVVFLLTAVAAAHATWIGSGIMAPGLINGGIVSTGLNGGILTSGVGLKSIISPVASSSVVAIPGAISTDKRVIGASSILAGRPLVNGMWSNGIMGAGLINGGILAPGLGAKSVVSPVATSSVVGIPGAISTDKRAIGASSLLTGIPLANGMWSNGILGASSLGAGVLGNGIVGPLGLKNAGIIGGSGILKSII